MADRRSTACVVGLLLVCVFGMVSSAVAQQTSMARAPRDWAVQTAANEVAILRHKDSFLRYRMHVLDSKGDQTRDVIESKDGTVARLILRDGKPLTADEDAAERARLEELASSPAAFSKHIKNEDSGKKLADDLIRMMPDAMLYSYVPEQPPSAPRHSGEVVLNFHPNPKWTPPSTPSAALTGLEGRMWIDTKTGQMVRMEGHIFKPINFGWGMLARIYPGGNLLIEQTDAGGGRWIYTHFKQEVTVRALMVKQIAVHTEVNASAYQVIAPMTYQKAIQTLLATPLPR